MSPKNFYHPRYWPIWTGIYLLRLLSYLPLPVLWLLGSLLGELIFQLAHKRRHIARRNIERCFPSLAPHEHIAITKRHFRALGQVLLSIGIPWWGSERRLSRLIHIHHIEILDHARANKRNVILMAPHFIALEQGLWLSHNRKIVYMYQHARNRLFDHCMKNRRLRFDGQLIERNTNLKDTIKQLKNGIPLAYLPDQNPGSKQRVFAPFFGIPTATHTSLSRLAKMANALVIPCIIKQRPYGRGYDVELKPPLEEFPQGDALADATQMNREIEHAIRDMPEQYFWVHKRFKDRPPGESDDFYT